MAKGTKIISSFFFKSLGLDNDIVEAYIIFFSLLQMDNPFLLLLEW